MPCAPLARLTFALIASTVVLLGGCQGTGGGPTAPSTPQGVDPATPLEVGGLWSGKDVGVGPMARYQLQLDGDNATIIPARLGQATVGQHFNADITDALQGGFCNTCLTLDTVQRDGTDLLVTLAVTHPFPLADDERIPDASNRRDLWISNVKGILLTEGDSNFFGGAVKLDATTLLNADGYTSILKPRLFNTNTFPYKVFGAESINASTGNYDSITGWSSHLDDPSGYNILANGQTARATYRFRLNPGQQMGIDLVLTAAFSVSAPDRSSRLAPQHFMPAAASPEPWRAEVSVAGTLAAFDPESSVQVTFKALDWQQDPALAVDPAFPDANNRRGLAVSSRISGITYSLPGITDVISTPVDTAGSTGAGTLADPYTVSATISNVRSAAAGVYQGLAKFIDERDATSGSAPFGTTTFIGPDLVTPYADVTEFATYALFSVTVSNSGGDCQPVQQVRQAFQSIYPSTNSSFVWCRTQGELDAALAAVEGDPGPMPPVNFATQSVVVACTGRTPQGHSQRTVRVDSACEDGAGGITITLLRGEPIGGCQLVDVSAVPYVVSIVDSVASEPTFVEDIYDTCLADNCQPVDWYIVDEGDAALNGYGDADPLFVLCANDTCYEDYAQLLYGGNPIPEFDHENYNALIICTGYTDGGYPNRDVTMLNVCRETELGHFEATYREKEYRTCPPPADSEPSAPFVIVAVEQPAMGWDWTVDTVDICAGPPCETELDFDILAQGDVRSQVDGPARFERFQSALEFDAAWSEFFPELAIPNIDFGSEDAYLLALAQMLDTGNRRIEVTNVCFNTTGGDEVEVKWKDWKAMTGSCPRPDGQVGRPVVFIKAPKQSSDATVNFQASQIDSCNVPECTMAVPTVIESGDAAALWASEGLDLVINNQAEFNRAWEAVHDDGSSPPFVDFSTFFVTFTTTGFEPEGFGLYDVGVKESCVVNTRATVVVTEHAPVSCPPPIPPEPTAPYRFDRIARGSGPVTGDFVWFGFDHEQLDTCAAGGNCTDAPAHVIAVGGYANDTATPQRILAGTQEELNTAWPLFFDFPQGDAPLLDFANYDAILQSAGWTDGGSGSRGLWFTGLCVDATEEYLKIYAHRDDWVWESCPLAEDSPSCPWVLSMIPKGVVADSWEIEIEYEVGMPFECQGTEWVMPATELGASYDSLYDSTASYVELFKDEDLTQRLQDYRDAWAFFGTGEPPGIDTIGQFDAILFVADGWWETNWGKHDLLLEAMSISYDLTFQRAATVRVLPSELCGEDRPTSPYRIYKVPLIRHSWYDENLGYYEACD